MIKDWVFAVVFLNLKEPRAVSLEFYDTKEEAIRARNKLSANLSTRTDDVRPFSDLRAVFRWDELPEEIQTRAASLSILPLDRSSVRYVEGTGGRTRSGVWVEFDDAPEFTRQIRTRQEELIVELGVDADALDPNKENFA